MSLFSSKPPTHQLCQENKKLLLALEYRKGASGPKVPESSTAQDLGPGGLLPLLHKMIGGLSLFVGDVGTCKDLISHQGKPVSVIVGGLEDHVERHADRSCTVLKWNGEFGVCEDAQGDDGLPSVWNMVGAVSREE